MKRGEKEIVEGEGGILCEAAGGGQAPQVMCMWGLLKWKNGLLGVLDTTEPSVHGKSSARRMVSSPLLLSVPWEYEACLSENILEPLKKGGIFGIQKLPSLGGTLRNVMLSPGGVRQVWLL